MPKKSNKVRKDGRIAVQVYIGMVDGKRKYKTVYGVNQKEADKKADEIRAKLGKGIDISSNLSFTAFIDMFLQNKEISICYNAYSSYFYCAEHLKKSIGYLLPQKIKKSDIQNVINALAKKNPNTNKPTSKRTLQMIKTVAVGALEIAVDDKIIEFNPAEKVSIPKNAPKKRVKSITPDQRTWIIDTPHRMQAVCMIAMFAGLRRGEIIALKKSDIDLDNDVITVNKIAVIDNGKTIIKDGSKTEAGNRKVPIPLILHNYLLEFFENKNGNSIFIIPNLNGGMMSISAFKSAFDSYFTELNIKYGTFFEPIKSKYQPEKIPMSIQKFTFHQLRHCYATLLYNANVDLLSATKWFGHSDSKTMMEIYTDLENEKEDFSVTSFNEYIDDRFLNASQMQVINS